MWPCPFSTCTMLECAKSGKFPMQGQVVGCTFLWGLPICKASTGLNGCISCMYTQFPDVASNIGKYLKEKLLSISLQNPSMGFVLILWYHHFCHKHPHTCAETTQLLKSSVSFILLMTTEEIFFPEICKYLDGIPKPAKLPSCMVYNNQKSQITFSQMQACFLVNHALNQLLRFCVCVIKLCEKESKQNLNKRSQNSNPN